MSQQVPVNAEWPDMYTVKDPAKKKIKVVMSSDTHGFHRHIHTQIPECDLFIHTGDFTNRGEFDVIQDFFAWLKIVPAKHIVFIAGNHDIPFEAMPHALRNLIAELPPHIHYLDTERLVIPALDNLVLYGVPWVDYINGHWAFELPPWDEISGETSDIVFGNIDEDVNILLTHSPPKGIMDNGFGNKQLSRALYKMPDLKIHAFGHVHESYGTVTLGNIKLVNSCCWDYRKESLNPPVVLEI